MTNSFISNNMKSRVAGSGLIILISIGAGVQDAVNGME